MRAETGWGSSTGRAPKPHRAKPSRSSGGGGGGSNLPSWPSSSQNNDNTPTQWGAKLDYRRQHDEPQKFYEPKPAQQGLDGNQWSEVLQQVFRPQDVRAEKERAERKVQQEMKADRAERSATLDTAGASKPKVERMTWHEYNLLTPRQRAAVDFNTMLVRAVRKDIANQDEYEPGPDQSKRYQASLVKAFGDKDRGSDTTYAPETMALLKQIDFHDVDSDLDDFLKLRTAITAKDLRGWDNTPDVPGLGAAGGLRTEQQEVQTVKENLAANTQELEQKLANGNAMIHSLPALAAQERTFISKAFGGTANTGKAPLGYQPAKFVPGTREPADMNTYFIQAYEQLAGNAVPGTTKGQILGAAREVMASHDVPFEDFLGYLNDRSNTAQQFGQDLGDVRGVKYRSPQEFRKMLGMGEGTTR